MRDIHSLGDIIDIVDAFYTGIEQDPDLGRFFDGVNLERHITKVYAFWAAVVFQPASDHQPFEIRMSDDGLEPHHLEAWVRRLTDAIGSRFSGPNAQRMKSRAAQLAWVFGSRLENRADETLAELADAV